MGEINTTKVVNKSKFNKFHFKLIFWSFFLIIFDGYDLVLYGTAVPMLIEDWGLSEIEAGTLSSYGLFGMMFGAIGFGILADRIGRKNVIAITLVLFSLFTCLCGFAANTTQFGIYRFLAGLGLGGIMPNVIALATDFAPERMKNLVVSIVLCGYSIGGILAPVLGLTLMPIGGWRSIFWVAILPIFALPFLLKQLPETFSYLNRTNRKKEAVNTLRKIDPNLNISMNDTIKDIKVSTTKVPLMDLFKENRAISTVLFWLTFFCCLLMIFGLNTWLPNLMMRAGYELNSSLMFLIVLQVGAIVGTLIIGKLCDKFGSKKLLVPLYIAGAISLSLLSLGKDVNIFVIYILIAIAGAATIGSQNLVQAFVSQYFPAYIRSTALGTASGIGRVGGMIGPLMGGFLLTFALPMPMYFIAFAIPGLIAALALYLIPMQHASEEYKKTYQVKDVPKDVPNEVK